LLETEGKQESLRQSSRNAIAGFAEKDDAPPAAGVQSGLRLTR
jgi:hypothetical protein